MKLIGEFLKWNGIIHQLDIEEFHKLTVKKVSLDFVQAIKDILKIKFYKQESGHAIYQGSQQFFPEQILLKKVKDYEGIVNRYLSKIEKDVIIFAKDKKAFQKEMIKKGGRRILQVFFYKAYAL
jgi:hypothetical protein